MAFNFGASAPSGGFPFGAAKTTVPAGGGFNFAAATAAAPQTTSTFGSVPTPAPQSGFSFGAATSASTGFTFGASSAPAPAAAAAVAPLFTPVASAAPSATTSAFSLGASTTAGGKFQFGAAAPATAAAPTFSLGSSLQSKPATSKLAAPVAAGFSFGATSTAQPAANLAVASDASTSAFNFAAKPAAAVSATLAKGFTLGSAAPTLAASSAPAAAVAPTLTFGATPAAAAAKTSVPAPVIAATTAASTGFSFKTGASGLPSATKAIGATATAPVAATTGLSAVTAPAKQMSYKELEETVEKWLHDLDEQEKSFLNQAAQVNTWDKQLIENGEKVTELNNEVERVKSDQQRLDRELDFILSQQEELEEVLQPIEAQVKSQQMAQHIQHSDVERERTYNLAENIDAQLKRMMEDLREIIERINNSNVNPNQGADETMGQIGKILNSHMDSLQWIDQNTNQLQKRVEDVNQLMETRRVEHDRTFHLSYDRD